MPSPDFRIRMFFLGAPRFETASGPRIEITSKKGIALLAALATSERMERSRGWLQQLLWGSREQKQAQSSLRRELSNLRAIFSRHGVDLLRSDHRVVELVRDKAYIDFLDEAHGPSQPQFCEGLDLAREDEFEDWLRDMRSHFEEKIASNRRDPRMGSREASAPALVAKISILQPGLTSTEAGAAQIAGRIHASLCKALTNIRWLSVAATETGRSDARYLLQTQLLGGAPLADVNFSFIEMPGSVIRWTETRTLDLSDNCAVLKELYRIANCVSILFENCEQRHVAESTINSPLTLHDYRWQIRHCLDKLTDEAFTRADELLKEALAKYPDDHELLLLRARLAVRRHWLDRADASNLPKLSRLIREALHTDLSDACGSMLHGVLDIWERKGRSAIMHLRRACELDPSMADAFLHLGAAHYLSGDAESAIAPIEHALFLSPLDPRRFYALGELATALWMLGRYQESLAIAQDIQVTHPDYVLAHILETASYSAMGCMKEALASRSQLLDQQPELYDAVLDWLPFQCNSWNERLREQVEFDRAKLPNRFATRTGM